MRGVETAAIQCLCYALLALGCGRPEPVPEQPRHVLTQIVGVGADAVATSYSGEVRSRYETALAFRIPGKIVSRRVDVGAEVKTGEILAELDPADTRLSQVSAMAQLELADADLRRYRDLNARNFVSQAALDAKEAARKTALAQAELAKNQHAYTVLRADKAGVIDQIFVESGQVVAAGQAVMRHSRSDTPEVAVAIPESRVVETRVGQNAEIRLWAADQVCYRGRIRELAAVADPVSRTYSARVTILDPDARVRLGMTANVRFSKSRQEADAPPVLSVPLSALFQKDGSPAVWVVGTDLTLNLRSVTVQSYGETEARISGGVTGGERIVIAGVHKLAAGEKIKSVDYSPSR